MGIVGSKTKSSLQPKCSFHEKQIDDFFDRLIQECQFKGTIPSDVLAPSYYCSWLDNPKATDRRNEFKKIVDENCRTKTYSTHKTSGKSPEILLSRVPVPHPSFLQDKKRQVFLASIMRLAGVIIRKIQGVCQHVKKNQTLTENMSKIESECLKRYWMWYKFLQGMEEDKDRGSIKIRYEIPSIFSQPKITYYHELKSEVELNHLLINLKTLQDHINRSSSLR